MNSDVRLSLILLSTGHHWHAEHSTECAVVRFACMSYGGRRVSAKDAVQRPRLRWATLFRTTSHSPPYGWRPGRSQMGGWRLSKLSPPGSLLTRCRGVQHETHRDRSEAGDLRRESCSRMLKPHSNLAV